MAEGLWRALGGGDWEVLSAGSRPAGYVHPMAIKVMNEISIDISAHQSNGIDEVGNRPFDLVVTVCESAKESCPVFPGARRLLHWPFTDPAMTEGSDEQRLAVFRQIRDRIRDVVAAFLETGSAK